MKSSARSFHYPISYDSQNFVLRIREEWSDSSDDDNQQNPIQTQSTDNDIIIISDSETSSDEGFNKLQPRKIIYNEIISDSSDSSILSPVRENNLISSSDDTHISATPQIRNSPKPPKRVNDLGTKDLSKRIESKQLNYRSSNKIHPQKSINDIVNSGKPKVAKNLSELKKKYVADWIHTNSPAPPSDSCSHISGSIRSNESSGNSSLERLELIYETPNNRHKFRNVGTKSHESLFNANDGSSKPTVKDCTDVLDRLYGTQWRTLKKTTNIKKQTSSTSRPKTINREVKRRTKTRDSSFINDSSESETESIYHTALTNLPIFENNRETRPKPVSELTKRLSKFCDPDTDTEDERPPLVKNPINKKLTYESDDTSTSEFDPTDRVSPKPTKKPEKKRPDPVEPTKVEPVVSSTKREGFLKSLSEFVPINDVHPNVIKYRTDYKNTKDQLARYLFKLYNEKVFENKLPNDMEIQWNVRMRGTAGFCYNKKITKAIGGILRSSRIALSTKILDKPDRLRDTLIHEMCHSAAWIINGVSDGHGPFWKSWASRAMKTFPELPSIKRCHDYKINTKFTYRCTGCGYSIGRHSKSLDVQRKRCGLCYGEFELLINRTTKSGNFRMDTPSKREPSAFALYVKENYSTVKKDNGHRKHGDVMKALGQQFSALKVAKQNKND